MSLHQLANHLQSAGRGEDKVLVHMTPKEVHGLQQLAMAHGGSLTINPETGLAEAGFLSSMLPMLAGAAAMFVPGLQGLGAGWIGAGIGGLTAISTGSLQKGLMAGLGAYGGAGLAGGLMQAGAAGAAGAAGTGSAGLGAAGAGAGVAPLAPVATTAANTVAPVAADAVATGAANTASGFGAGSNVNYMAQQFAQPINAQATSVLANAATPVQAVNAVPNIAGTDVNFMSKAYAQQAQALPAGSMQSTPMLSDWEKAKAGFGNVTSSGKNAWEFVKDNPGAFLGAGTALAQGMQKDFKPTEQNQGMIRPYEFTYGSTGADTQPYSGSAERTYFNPVFTAKTPYKAPGPEYAADGGLMGLSYAMGGATLALPDRPPIEEATMNQSIGRNNTYPMANQRAAVYSSPINRPMMQEVIDPSGGPEVDPYTGEPKFAGGGMTEGHLGGYSDGGRLLRGPGDGVSDSIPAVIGNKQPARLADGEFVIPARIVSELGNGSTEAGAKRLYAMMDRVQKARGKTTGKGRVAVNSRADKHLPA